MKRNRLLKGGGAALALAAVLSASPALADRPSWAGHGKKEDRWQGEERGGGRDSERDWRDERREHGGFRFDDRRRIAIRDYYAREYRRGHCPPGLAKKHDGCMPPGLARQWRVGEPLPRDVAYYDLPPSLVVQIGVPPAGYRYVRVASDILMIATGTGMVVDAINDLGQR